MTGTPFSSSMLNAMSNAIAQLNADISANASAATLQSDVVAYYNLQTSVRYYATEAAEVAGGTSFNGAVANINVENYVNSVGGNWAITSSTIRVQLALADWNTIKNITDGNIPTLYDVAQEHITVFGNVPISGTNLTNIPITYWSGTAFGYENLNWLGSLAQSAELGGQSQTSLFSSLSPQQVANSIGELLVALGQTPVSAFSSTPAAPFEAITDFNLAHELLSYVLLNGSAALVQDVKNLFVTQQHASNGSTSITVQETQLEQQLDPAQSATGIPASFTFNSDASGNFRSLTTDSSNGTSTITTDAGGTIGTMQFVPVSSYTGLDGTGALDQTIVTLSSGGTETVAIPTPGDLPQLQLAGGASVATTYTVGTGGATLTQIANEVGMSTALLAGLNTSLSATATLASGTTVNLFAETGWTAAQGTINTGSGGGTPTTYFNTSATAGPSYTFDLATALLQTSNNDAHPGVMYLLDNGVLVNVLPAGWLQSTYAPSLQGPITFNGTGGQYITYTGGSSTVTITASSSTAPGTSMRGDAFTGAVTASANAYNCVNFTDSTGTGTINFNNLASTGALNTDLWTVGAGTDTGTLQAGLAGIIFTGVESQYSIAYNSTSKTLTVTDGVSGRNGAKTIVASGGGAVLTFAGNGVVIVGTHYAANDGGTSSDTLLNDGAASSTTIYGTETLTMVGNGGNDTYKINATNNETDVIQNGVASSNAAAGAITFTGQYVTTPETHNKLWFAQSSNGNDLLIYVLGTTEVVDVQNWFASGDAYAQVTQIVASDGTLLYPQVQGLVTAMATYSAANPGFSPQTATALPTDTALNAAEATAWNAALVTPAQTNYKAANAAETFDLQAGNAGNNIYAFTPGPSGNVLDVVNSATGTVKLGTAIGNDIGIVGFDASGNVVSVTPTGGEVSQGGLGSAWTLLGAVDTTGQGRKDLLWYNASTGALDLWASNGAGYTDKGTVDTGLTGTWRMVYSRPAAIGAAAQVMLLQPGGSSGGSLRALTISDYHVTDTPLYEGGSEITPIINGGSSIGLNSTAGVYAGDFNGDGNSDVLFRWTVSGTNTALYVWDMAGNTIVSGNYLYASATTPIDGGNNVGLHLQGKTRKTTPCALSKSLKPLALICNENSAENDNFCVLAIAV